MSRIDELEDRVMTLERIVNQLKKDLIDLQDDDEEYFKRASIFNKEEEQEERKPLRFEDLIKR